jgi:hypothetical protein
MEIGIGLILELAGQEPAVRVGEFDRLCHHGHRAPRCRCQHNLGAKKAHELAPLDAELRAIVTTRG